MATIRETLRRAARQLEAAGVPDAAADAALLLSHVTGEAPLSLRADAGRPLSAETLAAFDALLARRAAREPLQYITGEAPFMGLMLRAEPGVLIPRFDTETLCEQALARLQTGQRALDVCTGSGALTIALASQAPGARVSAGDISETALALARKNAARCGVSVDFRLGDLFAPFQGETFHLILSNPPYIPTPELAGLQPEVRFEPALALDGGPDGLAFYRRIIRQAPASLEEGGWLLLEIGSSQAEAVRKMMAAQYEEIAVYTDLNGLDRAVAGRKKHGLCT